MGTVRTPWIKDSPWQPIIEVFDAHLGRRMGVRVRKTVVPDSSTLTMRRAVGFELFAEDDQVRRLDHAPVFGKPFVAGVIRSDASFTYKTLHSPSFAGWMVMHLIHASMLVAVDLAHELLVDGGETVFFVPPKGLGGSLEDEKRRGQASRQEHRKK
jgi:hypothetical protein